MIARAPAISIATSVFNAERYLAAAIESVLAQEFGDFEFLLLDDGSTDASRTIAEDYAARDSRIRLTSRENRGLVASLNELLEQARAPLIARFDADDICAPQRLGRQKVWLDAHSGHGLVGSETRYIDMDGRPGAIPEIDRPHEHLEILANFESGPNLCHPAVMYRRRIVTSLGGYRAAYRHAEDIDLWLRMSEVTLLANLPEPLLDYRVTPDQISSRHVVTQAVNAAVAWLAHGERAAGRPDPTANCVVMPPLDQLDGLFGPGAAEYVRRRVFDRVQYNPEALADEGWEILLQHAAENGNDPRLWRTAARLLRAGQPRKAGKVAAALVGLAA